MPLNTIEKLREICQLKVTLLGTDPPIWRRLLVPADLTLERLHDVPQLAMGWEDCHMHEFRIGKQRFGKPDPMEQVFGGPRTASERTAHLSKVLGRARAKAVYTYDFGDSWDHEILVEKCLAAEPERAYTPEEVLVKVLIFFAADPWLRIRAIETVRESISNPAVHIVPQSLESFTAVSIYTPPARTRVTGSRIASRSKPCDRKG